MVKYHLSRILWEQLVVTNDNCIEIKVIESRVWVATVVIYITFYTPQGLEFMET